MNTVTDAFGRTLTYIRLSVTGRCNFKCTYCSIPNDHADLMSGEEIVRIARIVASLGVVKIRLTGGEPTVRNDLVDIVREVKKIPGIQKLVMTTNGARFADLAPALKDAGLTGVNISLDSLHAERIRSIARGGELESVLHGIEAARQLKFHPLKINMVVMKGVNEDEVMQFADLAAQAKGEIEVRYIEYMPMTRGEERDWILPYQVLLERIRNKYPLEALPVSMDAGPAERYRMTQNGGVIGFIHAMSNPFCQRCNRLRVTAEGRIRSCLLSGGEIDLISPMRAGASDHEIAKLFRQSAFEKPEVYELHRHGDVTMRAIGG